MSTAHSNGSKQLAGDSHPYRNRPPPGTARKVRKLRLATLDHLDGRTFAAKRCRELVNALQADLGGPDHITEGVRQLIQRAAVLGTFIESCEALWLGGDSVELSDYLRAINSQRRVLMVLGLERKPRDVTPSLETYLADKSRDDVEEAD